jgi:hypothetical protein
MKKTLNKPNLRTHTEVNINEVLETKFIESCISLDERIIEPYIDELGKLINENKYKFLKDLKDQFDRARERGVHSTTLKLGECTSSCPNGGSTMEFYCENDLFLFAFRFKIVHGKNEGIYKCWFSSGSPRRCEPGDPF